MATWRNALAIVALVLLLVLIVGLPALYFINDKALNAEDLTVQATIITARATVMLVVATLMLVLVTLGLAAITGWFMKEQNDRARRAQSTELFLQLRQRAISPEHAARRRRVIALLDHLKKRGIKLDKLEFSPDIALYLNDYQWIGRLVQDGMLTEDYAWATYGRNLLILYPMLEPYITKERKHHGSHNRWRGVSNLYEKFKQIHEDCIIGFRLLTVRRVRRITSPS